MFSKPLVAFATIINALNCVIDYFLFHLVSCKLYEARVYEFILFTTHHSAWHELDTQQICAE